MPRPKLKEPLGPTIAMRFHPAESKAIKSTARETRLSEQDVVRQSVIMGLPALRAALLAVRDKAA